LNGEALMSSSRLFVPALLILVLAPAGFTCEPEAEALARDALLRSGASVLDCPDDMAAVPGGKAICAIADGSVQQFTRNWDMRMALEAADAASGLSQPSRSERVYLMGDNVLTLNLRGIAMSLTCAPRDAPEAAASAPGPPSGATAGPDPVDPSKIDGILRNALGIAGAAPFACPAGMAEAYPGKALICAVYSGPFESFAADWGLPPSTAEPTSAWTGSTPHRRDYDVGGIPMTLIFNNGAVAITYEIPASVAPADR
jgi:hypothetical protein